MPAFKEMDPELVWEFIQGQENVLKPLVEKEEAFFRHSSCPTCRGSSNETFVNSQRPFTPGAVLPNRLMRCLQCLTEFDPYTGLITKASSSPIPPIDE